ncbi:type VI secretion system baseplate subunit TssK [Sulfitobacter albidus]|uniref:Type VI secretion system baseplate subunit TssK n=1 Tax=Sulfitobacter albidus TaxID=2829501 RepID=A0A975PNR1_9RHOB|nr:type VI secretion system baseplate subunit TssK [Sulfitobacter albidus]QUJ78122.1 type VI secretion system baseplate subunit TssK [Sulfitobacter albidus]
MSRFSKVAWKEGLFLKPQHFQQADRYMERFLTARTMHLTPFPWGISEMTFDQSQLRQGKLELEIVAGIMPDGTPFDAPHTGPLPREIDVPEEAIGKLIWLTLPNAAQNDREVGLEDEASLRYALEEERGVADTASASRIEESLEIAVPRLELTLRDKAREGYQCICLGRVADVSDGTIVTLDQSMPPTGLVLAAHRAFEGYLKAVTGSVEARLEVLERYAADPTSGGGMQDKDYLMLMVLNRNLPILRHLARMPSVHPERLFETLAALAGELATFEDRERRVRDYGRYRHDQPKETFKPLVDDIRRLLSRDVGRALRLPLEQRRENSFAAIVEDPNLYANSTFVIEVAAALPLTQIQQQFPQLCKVGPSTRMKEIIVNNMPGITLVHTPNPPPQIRVVANHVYFVIDKMSPLWREFSVAPALGMHFAGAWPGLELELWAIPEGR